MRDSAYAQATMPEAASAAVAADEDAMFVAGAADIVHLLGNEVFAPARLVDILRRPGLPAWSFATAAAADPLVRGDFPPSRRRSWPPYPASSATWRRWAATCSSGPGATTAACPATAATAAARPLKR